MIELLKIGTKNIYAAFSSLHRKAIWQQGRRRLDVAAIS